MSESLSNVPEGVIENMEDAHDLANREKELREEMGKEIDALAREKETGLTKEQELNVGVMHHLENKYKNAFEPVVYGREDVARRAIIMVNVAELDNFKTRALVSTRNGLFRVQNMENYSEELYLNLAKSLAARIDSKMENKGKHISGNEWTESFRNIVPEEGEVVMDIQKLDLTSDENKMAIHGSLKRNEGYKRARLEEAKLPELDELVEGL